METVGRQVASFLCANHHAGDPLRVVHSILEAARRDARYERTLRGGKGAEPPISLTEALEYADHVIVVRRLRPRYDLDELRFRAFEVDQRSGFQFGPSHRSVVQALKPAGGASAVATGVSQREQKHATDDEE